MKREIDKSTDEDFPDGIELGKKYKLLLRFNENPLFSVQYGFKPNNIDTTQPGSLVVDTSHGEAKSYLYRKDEDHPMEFRGILMQSLSESSTRGAIGSTPSVQGCGSGNNDNHFMLEFDNDNQQFLLKPFSTTILNLRQIIDDESMSAGHTGPETNGPELLKKYLHKAKQNQMKKAKRQQDQEKAIKDSPAAPTILEEKPLDKALIEKSSSNTSGDEQQQVADPSI